MGNCVTFDDISLDFVQKYEYISFDVFDTLIFRSVEKPEQVFEIVKEKVSTHLPVSLDSFVEERINAEKEARRNKGTGDCTLNEIYNKLNFENRLKDIIKDIEQTVELDNCFPNIRVLNFLRQCKSNGKKIVLTTDMYLPLDFFQKLTSKLGINVDHIFVSGVENATKRSGYLYDIVLNTLGINADKIIHFGDNYNNDILQAQSRNIQSVAIPQLSKLCSVYRDNKINLINSRLDTIESIYYKDFDNNTIANRIGFSVIGPFLYNFCSWIHIQKEKLGIKKLYFLSREGFLIKKAYEIMYPEEVSDCFYLKINKNVLRLPLMFYGDCINVLKRSVLKRKEYNWDYILSCFLVPQEKRRYLLEKLKIEKEVFNRIDLESGVLDNYLQKIFEYSKDVICSQHSLFQAYLEEQGICQGKVALINNSINGNGQLMLEDFLTKASKSPNIIGFQFVASQECRNNLNNRLQVYSDSTEMSSFQINEFIRNCLVFEHMLFEPIGTCVRLEMHEGHPFVLCEQQRKECSNNKIVSAIQKGTLDFISLYHTHCPTKIDSIGFYSLIKLLYYPSTDDAKMLCGLWDDDADKDQMISDTSIPVKFSYFFYKNIPDNIMWLEGYLSAKGYSNVSLKFLQVKLMLSYYQQNLRCFRMLKKKINNRK